jgi:YebC/PmpR family DNA-binding regulatory protein
VSGHSKWATTKHKKGAIDAKRGKLFAKLIKTIEVAAKTGGGDPSGNPRLADAISGAKRLSVPADNIERAVKRGSGELGDAASYEEIMYEAYGPGGVAVLVECLTDNRNRPRPRSGPRSPATAATRRTRARCPTCSAARASSSSRAPTG